MTKEEHDKLIGLARGAANLAYKYGTEAQFQPKRLHNLVVEVYTSAYQAAARSAP